MSDRIENLSADEVCPWCADTPGRHGPSGMVVVARRDDQGRLMDEMGPCPACEAGLRLEMRRWRDGFWRGRDPEAEPPLPDGIPLSRLENALRMRLLNRRMGGDRTADPLVGIDLRDAGKRIAMLERAVAK